MQQSCNTSCGLTNPSFTTASPESPTELPLASEICGLPDQWGNCNCGCGTCAWQNQTYCCDCPPRSSFYGQNFPSYDYHDHILTCTSAVTAISDVRPNNVDFGSCLGTYAGPIFPNVVLGGYDCQSDPTGATICNYQNATAIIITLPIVNHVDETLNGPAEAWEKAFLDYMANYSSPIFTMAYSAERSTSVRARACVSSSSLT